MARRRDKSADIVLGVVQLLVLAIGASIFIPGIRQVRLGFGMVALAVLALVLVVGLGVLIIRRTARPPLGNAQDSTLQAAAPRPSLPPVQSATQRTTEDLIQQLRSIDWFQFEKVVAITYRKHGYTVTRRGGANPDGGIDVLIEKNGQQFAVQCKQWKTWNVGVKAVREFLGAMTDAKVQRGVFVTLGGYTGEAKTLAEKHGIEMLNETHLAKMLDAVDAKYDPEVQDALKDTRKFCPKCESEMVLRTARKGVGAGSQFWGCSAYPRCRFTMQG